MADFFVKPPQEKRGCPRKVVFNRGRIASSTTPPSHDTAQAVPHPPRPKSAPPARRLAWIRNDMMDPDVYNALKSAIAAWNAMTPEPQRGQMPEFCRKRGLARETFRAYVRKDNPRKLGGRFHRRRAIIICGRRNRDNERANQGLTVPQIIDVFRNFGRICHGNRHKM